MARQVVVLLATPEGRDIVKSQCRKNSVRLGIFEELIEAELEQTGKMRKAGLWDAFDEILDRMGEED